MRAQEVERCVVLKAFGSEMAEWESSGCEMCVSFIQLTSTEHLL